MKIIIDIPEETYEHAKELVKTGYEGGYEVIGAIAHGTLLKQEKVGHWICDEKGTKYADYHCSECGQVLQMCFCTIENEQKDGRHLFCNRCGARMEG